MTPTVPCPAALAIVDEQSGAPRDNGELVFDAPWQARALALVLALVEHTDLEWDTFRRRLVDAIAAEPARPYYDTWAIALESLVISLGLTTPAALDAAERGVSGGTISVVR